MGQALSARLRCARAKSSLLRFVFLGIVRQGIRYEDLRGITRPGVRDSQVDELGERDFSLLAISSARDALPAATAFSPESPARSLEDHHLRGRLAIDRAHGVVPCREAHKMGGRLAVAGLLVSSRQPG
jgi:hypothetical protein